MITTACKLILVTGLLASGGAALIPTTTYGCDIQVRNNGTVIAPNYVPFCSGQCVDPYKPSCVVSPPFYYQEETDGPLRVLYWCNCNGIGVAPIGSQDCVGNWGDSGGVWHFTCVKDGCQASPPFVPCYEGSPPAPGTTAVGCSCL